MSRRQVPVALGSPMTMGMVMGPDGNMWFADWAGSAIVKIDQSTGSMTSYTAGMTAGAAPSKIVVGPGASPDLWFTESTTGKIGKITTAGVITEYPVADASVLGGLALGPDGNLWFCDVGRNSIGKAVIVDGAIIGVSLYALPSAGALPKSITAGPASDGTLWFTEFYTSKIGKITTTGIITEFATPTAAAQPTEIVLGGDGNLWFAERNASKIGKITTVGVITEYSLPSDGAFPQGIASVGNELWFTEQGTNKLAKITTSGAITEYTVPTRKSLPVSVASGPSSTVWFLEGAPRKVAKFTIATSTFTEYTLPDGNSGATGNPKTSMPGAITVGPDGNLWFTAPALNRVGKMTTAGVSTLYPVSTSRAWPTGIATDAGGNIWSAEGAQGKIAKITTSGTVTEYDIPTAMGYPDSLVKGPDGNVWFVEYAASKIGKITTSGTVTEYDLVHSGSSLPKLPNDITVGPDNNLWYTAHARNAIGKIVIVAGVVVDVIEYPVGWPPRRLTSGGAGSGALWFTMWNTKKLGKITTGGLVTKYDTPVPGSFVTLGPDGNIWFTSMNHRKVVKFVPGSAPTTTEYTLSDGAMPLGIVTGPDGNLWITDYARGLIIKMTTSGAPTEYNLTDD